MDSPVSAFHMYRQLHPAAATKGQKQSPKPKNKLKKKSQPLGIAYRPLDESVEKILGGKIKNMKKKQKKHIGEINGKKDKLKKKRNKINGKQIEKAPKKVSKQKNIQPKVQNVLPKPLKVQNGHVTLLKNGLIHDDDCNLTDDSASSITFEPVTTDSAEEGLKAFEWLIAPYDSNEFLNKIWEKKPLHIARKKPNYYKDIISTPLIDNMLRTENILFTKNIDITSYSDGKRETHNPIGRAHPHVVWDYYLNGCSIRLLNPQTYLPRLLLLNATLQEFFNSFVGANAYLTPPDSQGFAPHYDDIEALIMQIEGKKLWKVYKPLSENEYLPRVSSKNFDQEEIGEPILEVTLEAGDMLYFPRGYIHQGVTIDGEHSLHVTVSFYQKHCWADLFEKMLPAALQAAISENVDLRRGLPFDIYDNFGLVNSDVNTLRKQDITNLIKTLFDKVKDYLPIDGAVDEMSKNFQHTALPPVLSSAERACTIYGDSNLMIKNGKVTQRVEIELDTKIRLLRKNILRMVMEEDGVKIYFYTENSLEYQGNELQFLEIDERLAPAVETLVMTYPEYVSVENLDIEDESDRIQLANDFWEKGLIITEHPLDPLDDD